VLAPVAALAVVLTRRAQSNLCAEGFTAEHLLAVVEDVC
jgi:hypothetical protein